MPVILVTSMGDTQDIVAGLDAGADEYLTKPVDQAALLASVRSVLRLKALQDRVMAQAADLANWNRTLEQRVAEQVAEIERLGRLKRFLPPQIVQLVVSSGHERLLESHRRDVTVLFCDLRGFTAFSEISEPEEVMLVLREYHTALGALVDKFEGTIDRFTGDGLLVIFNDRPDPSIRAVQMALEMHGEVAKLTAKWSRSGRDIGFAIGIAHGYATLGTVGYEGQFRRTFCVCVRDCVSFGRVQEGR
jgi:adenylate cyclase